MIVIPILLASAVTGQTTTLGTLVITNDGTGTKARRNYNVKVIGKRKQIIRRAKIRNWPSERRPVFDLVARALRRVGYSGRKPCSSS